MKITIKSALFSSALLFICGLPCSVALPAAPFDPSSLGLPPQGMPGGGPAMPAANPDAMFEEMFMRELQKAMEDPAYAQQLQKQGEEELRRAKAEGTLDVYAEALSMLTGQPVTVADLEEAISEFEEPGATPAAPVAAQPTPTPQPTTPPPAAASPKQPSVSTAATAEIRNALSSALAALESLRQKGIASPVIGAEIASFGLELQDMVLLLNTINTPEHHQRLLEPAHAKLMKQLISFSKQLSPLERSVLVPSEAVVIDNPYTTLGVPLFAAQAEVDAAYRRLKDEKSPEALTQRLQARGVTGQQRERELKNARIIWREIQDAYDQLATPQARKRVDEGVQRELTAQRARMSQTLRYVDQIKELLTQTIYNDGLVTLLGTFVKEHEPAQHAMHQRLEKERAAREEEQKRRAQQASAKSPSSGEGRLDFGTHREVNAPSRGGTSGGGFSGGNFDRFDGGNWNMPATNPGMNPSEPTGGGIAGAPRSPAAGEMGPAAKAEDATEDKKDGKKGGSSGSASSAEELQDAAASLVEHLTKSVKALKTFKAAPSKPVDLSRFTTRETQLTQELDTLRAAASDEERAQRVAKEQERTQLAQERLAYQEEARVQERAAADTALRSHLSMKDIVKDVEDLVKHGQKASPKYAENLFFQARQQLTALQKALQVQPEYSAVLSEVDTVQAILDALQEDPKKAQKTYKDVLKELSDRSSRK